MEQKSQEKSRSSMNFLNTARFSMASLNSASQFHYKPIIGTLDLDSAEDYLSSFQHAQLIEHCFYILNRKKPPARNRQDLFILQYATQNINFFDNMIKEKGSDTHQQCVKYIFHETYSDGQFICQQGEMCEKFFIVISGECDMIMTERDVQNMPNGEFKIQLIENVVGKIKEGQTFGQVNLLSAQPASASIKCIGECQFFCLTKADFTTILCKQYSFSIQYYQIQSNLILFVKAEIEMKIFKDRVDFLQDIPVISKLSRKRIEEMMFFFQVQQLTRNTEVIVENSENHFLYIVKSGFVSLQKQFQVPRQQELKNRDISSKRQVDTMRIEKITKDIIVEKKNIQKIENQKANIFNQNTIKIARLGPGQIFGEIDTLLGKRANFSAKCDSREVELFIITVQSFKQSILENPDNPLVEDFLSKYLVEKVQWFNQQYDYIQKAIHETGNFFIGLYQSQNQIDYENTQLKQGSVDTQQKEFHHQSHLINESLNFKDNASKFTDRQSPILNKLSGQTTQLTDIQKQIPLIQLEQTNDLDVLFRGNHYNNQRINSQSIFDIKSSINELRDVNRSVSVMLRQSHMQEEDLKNSYSRTRQVLLNLDNQNAKQSILPQNKGQIDLLEHELENLNQQKYLSASKNMNRSPQNHITSNEDQKKVNQNKSHVMQILDIVQEQEKIFNYNHEQDIYQHLDLDIIGYQLSENNKLRNASYKMNLRKQNQESGKISQNTASNSQLQDTKSIRNDSLVKILDGLNKNIKGCISTMHPVKNYSSDVLNHLDTSLQNKGFLQGNLSYDHVTATFLEKLNKNSYEEIINRLNTDSQMIEQRKENGNSQKIYLQTEESPRKTPDEQDQQTKILFSSQGLTEKKITPFKSILPQIGHQNNNQDSFMIVSNNQRQNQQGIEFEDEDHDLIEYSKKITQEKKDSKFMMIQDNKYINNSHIIVKIGDQQDEKRDQSFLNQSNINTNDHSIIERTPINFDLFQDQINIKNQSNSNQGFKVGKGHAHDLKTPIKARNYQVPNNQTKQFIYLGNNSSNNIKNN